MGYKTPTCSIARRCGGCEWLSVPYPIQLKRKQAQVEELLAPLASINNVTIEPIRGMDEPLAYRHKAATPFAPGKGRTVRSGFYASGTHQIIASKECLVEDGRARAILNDVAYLAGQFNIHAYQEDRGKGALRHAVVRCGYATDDVMLVLVVNGQRLPHEQEFIAALRKAHPELTSIFLNVNQKRTNAILGRETRLLWGSTSMSDKLLNCTFEIGPTSFYQTNPQQTEALYQLAIDGALAGSKQTGATLTEASTQTDASAPANNLRILDAYCGTGTIGLCLAHVAEAQGVNLLLTGVDQVENNIQMARRNARNNKLEAEFICDDATRYMQALAKDGQNFDVIILDPPRAGSTPAFLKATAQLAQKKIVYVSCNVVTQARDLKVLLDSGFAIERVTPVDMFPHTKHVECVVVLSRAN
ncbi:RNA methyltransferase, TrmA family [Lancefieldella parvula DSM 20469]|uniref:RNA methyltransferase, TrmA family n=1 Tax=Lancefieldella parvula (strain ATCC 33793 / DSM 20469 / CCUG 32760 / JCM 10300 / KCTC 3663 / VPI 0546 / 1246) TaxID=521095 RepID=C8W8Q1_LANP1|nr:23S rRNA (uracil(1939)-C(5))-methyltransferase RlmD [Lancefieldella parvula]ACV50489.1 RNA methyltransferase, TrmA family [Lancefieldella parvula DSM 20469]